METVHRVIPVLVYENIAAAHDFLIEAFGFASGSIHRTAEGNAVHAEVRAGDFAIWLHRVTAEHHMAAPGSLGFCSSGLVVHVENVDAHCQRARSRGARVESEPRAMPYGQREYEARDLEGHRWWFASPMRTTA
ncbi:MAG TPA: VOC family protein [Verrucomicrobiae bacterium]|nr:VOC family protein [Verrucomicrobiae bacterium]